MTDNTTVTIAATCSVRYSPLDIEAGLSYDTTLRATVDPQAGYPHPQTAALMWIASRRHVFDGMEEFDRFRDDFERCGGAHAQELVNRWPQVFDAMERTLKLLFTSPKPVFRRPPWSLCPRCGHPIWAAEGTVDLRETRTLLTGRMRPFWCLTCGQRFKVTIDELSDVTLECRDEFSTEDTLRTIEQMFPVEQPSIDTLLAETATAS